MKTPQFTLRRMLLAVPILGIGFVVAIEGARRGMQNPRSNTEDAMAWCVWAAGMSLIGVGIGVLFRREKLTVLLGLLFPILGFVLLVAITWTWIICYAIWRAVLG